MRHKDCLTDGKGQLQFGTLRAVASEVAARCKHVEIVAIDLCCRWHA